MTSSNLTQISCPVAHRLKSGLSSSGLLLAFADNPSFKNVDCKIAAGSTAPAGGRAEQAIPLHISSPARLGAGEEAKEGLRPKNRIHSANDGGQS